MMKKFALSIVVAAAALFGAGGAALANPYPPFEAPGAGVTVSGGGTADGNAGGTTVRGTFTVEVTNCVEGENLVARFEGQEDSDVCSQSTGTGSATFTFMAGSTPGIFTGTITGDQGYQNTFSVNVIAAAPAAPVTPLGGLPATGSDGTSTMTMMALGFFIVGGGLLGVSQLRRRQTVLA